MLPSGDLPFIKLQVRRLRGLRNFPHDYAEAIAELAQALMSASTREAAERFVSDWLRETPVAPAPAEIYESLKPPAPPPPTYVKEPSCGLCGDSGWVSREVNGYMGARRCECQARPAAAPAPPAGPAPHWQDKGDD